MCTLADGTHKAHTIPVPHVSRNVTFSVGKRHRAFLFSSLYWHQRLTSRVFLQRRVRRYLVVYLTIDFPCLTCVVWAAEVEQRQWVWGFRQWDVA